MDLSNIENYQIWSLICWFIFFFVGLAIGWFIWRRRVLEYYQYDRDHRALLSAFNKRKRTFEENREIVSSLTGNEIRKNRR